MKQRSIWFQLLTLLLLSSFKAATKYGKICLRWVKGAAPDKPGA